jgi:phospholipid transport system transporter-binding protein
MNQQLDESGAFVLKGELTFDTVPEIYRETTRWLPQDDRFRSVDLSSVERVDSAGLSLLLDWQSSAQLRQRLLQFDNPPLELVRLAALCGADALLGFDRS